METYNNQIIHFNAIKIMLLGWQVQILTYLSEYTSKKKSTNKAMIYLKNICYLLKHWDKSICINTVKCPRCPTLNYY